MSRGTPRNSTVLSAIKEMSEALAFYRDGDWNDDYPGGINLPDDTRVGRSIALLDMGGRADRALRHTHVRAVLELLDR
jgi:hypothetical protein